MTSRRARPDRERGTASVELAGLLPVLLVAALVVLQIGLAGWTTVATGHAAKDAARAATLDRDPRAAAEGSLPGVLDADRVDVGSTPRGRRATVEVPIPSVLRLVGLDLGSVSRSAEMPDAR